MHGAHKRDGVGPGRRLGPQRVGRNARSGRGIQVYFRHKKGDIPNFRLQKSAVCRCWSRRKLGMSLFSIPVSAPRCRPPPDWAQQHVPNGNLLADQIHRANTWLGAGVTEREVTGNDRLNRNRTYGTG